MASYVMDYLQGRGVTFTVIPQREQERPPSGLAKTVVAIANFGTALLVIPEEREVDEALMRDALGDQEARLASGRELERAFPDYEMGALPPLSMLLLAPMYADPAIAEAEEITFPAGRRDVAIRMSTGDLFGGDPVVIAPLTAESRIPEPTA